MSKVDYFTLISGAPVNCGKTRVYPPRLGDIREIGYDSYREYVSLLLMDREGYAELFKVKDVAALEQWTTMQLITYTPPLRATLLQALSFFLHSDVCYSDDVGYFIDGKPVVYLTLDDLSTYRSIILRFCNIEDTSDQQQVTYRNARAKRTYEKIQKCKAKKRKQSAGDKNMELPNLIAAVSAFSATYNLLNIWGLTVYQFYDQFTRLSGKIQLGIIGQKWAAWGTDSFDFSAWYKALSTTE